MLSSKVTWANLRGFGKSCSHMLKKFNTMVKNEHVWQNFWQNFQSYSWESQPEKICIATSASRQANPSSPDNISEGIWCHILKWLLLMLAG